MKMKIIIGILLMIMIAGCSQESVKIGFVGPLSGPVANPGIDIKQGFELGIEDIKVFYEDGKCSEP